LAEDIISLSINDVKRRWLVAVGGGIAGVIFGFTRGILPIVFPFMKSTIEMNYQDLGILTSSYFFSYMISSFIWGHYSDKIGGKKIVLLGTFLSGTMTIGIGFMSHFLPVLLFSVAIGVGAGAIHIPMKSIILKWYKEKKTGFSVSIYSVGEGLQTIFVGIIIPLIVFAYSWRFVWSFLGMFSILLALGLLILIRDRPSTGESNNNLTPYVDDEGLNFYKIIKMPRMFQLSSIYFLHALVRGSFMTFIVTYLIKEGISFKIASGAYSSVGFGMIPGAVLSGIASDIFRRTRVMALLLIIQGISVSLILMIQKGLLIYFLVAMIGFSLSGVVTVIATIPSEYYNPRTYGKVLGFLTFVYGIGVTLSPFIGGVIADRSGSLTLTLLIFGAGASIIAGILALLIK
jgi:sugar phosphate permease